MRFKKYINCARNAFSRIYYSIAVSKHTCGFYHAFYRFISIVCYSSTTEDIYKVFTCILLLTKLLDDDDSSQQKRVRYVRTA